MQQDLELELRRRLDAARDARCFTAAAVEFGGAHKGPLRVYVGRDAAAETSRVTDERSVFDLASLTKVIGTTEVVKSLVARGRLALSQPVARWLPDWKGADRAAVTVEDLLAHASGLPAHLPLYRECQGLAGFVATICRTPLAYEPTRASLYSDLGFILLAAIAEQATGRAFRDLVDSWLTSQEHDDIFFTPGVETRARCVTTGFDRERGRELIGEVHDRNAWALGGVAGHAGLFGPLPAVGRYASGVLGCLRQGASEHPTPLDRRFVARSAVPGSSRALGWDTMLPTSSCGAALSSTAIGHTGFTGTSIWIDWERDVYSVLLTNRVATGATAEDILALRRAVHSLSAAFVR